MIVSKNWLAEYVDLEMPDDVLTDRLTMSGLNLEGVEEVGDDLAIDLEVTSNRPDCLGHIGVAREVSVLFDVPLKVPPADVSSDSESAASRTSVQIDCPDLCHECIGIGVAGSIRFPSPFHQQVVARGSKGPPVAHRVL